ncbi:MAG: hypothetical protein IT370_35760 [Deltaproteobacteria bacterium]|nr:hypothetical protein [Deltaproteobacteria bacterium]
MGRAAEQAAPSAPSTTTVAEWHVALAMTLLVMLTYSAVLVTPYAVTDDYVNYYYSKHGWWLAWWGVPGGRIMDAVAVGLSFKATRYLADLRWLRLLGVLGIALLQWLLYRGVRRAGWSVFWAASFAVLVGVTPAFQVCAAWATLWPVFYSAALTGVAFSLSGRALAAQRARVRWSLVAAVQVLLFVAITIYQVTGMFFVVFLAIDLFARGEHLPARLLRRLLWFGAMLGGGLVLGYLAFKIGMKLYPQYADTARAKLETSWLTKARWFWRAPLADAFQLFRLRPVKGLALLVSAFIAGGMWLRLHGTWQRRALALLLAAALLPLAYLPSLMAAGYWNAYRTQFAITPLVLLYGVCAVQGYLGLVRRAYADRVVSHALAAATLLACLVAARNVTTLYVEPQMAELRLLRGALAGADLRTAKRIWIRGSSPASALAWTRYDEWAQPSTAWRWALVPVAYGVAKEQAQGRMRVPISISDGPIKAGPREVAIDMSGLGTLK